MLRPTLYEAFQLQLINLGYNEFTITKTLFHGPLGNNHLTKNIMA